MFRALQTQPIGARVLASDDAGKPAQEIPTVADEALDHRALRVAARDEAIELTVRQADLLPTVVPFALRVIRGG